jgi:hypothetical protein
MAKVKSETKAEVKNSTAYKNARNGVFEIQGVTFEANEVKELTDEQLADSHFKHAIAIGCLIVENVDVD